MRNKVGYKGLRLKFRKCECQVGQNSKHKWKNTKILYVFEENKAAPPETPSWNPGRGRSGSGLCQAGRAGAPGRQAPSAAREKHHSPGSEFSRPRRSGWRWKNRSLSNMPNYFLKKETRGWEERAGSINV